MKHALLGFCAGVLIAAIAHAATWPTPLSDTSTEPSTEPERSPAPSTAPPKTVVSWVDDCPENAGSGPPSEQLQELRRRTVTVDDLEARLEEVIGAPEAFPPDLDERFTPSHAEATVQAVLDTVGEGEIDYVDCSEFPCIAAIRVPAGDGYLDELHSPLVEALGEQLGPPNLTGGYRSWMDSRAFVPLGEPADGPRLDYRTRVARQILDEDRKAEVEQHEAEIEHAEFDEVEP